LLICNFFQLTLRPPQVSDSTIPPSTFLRLLFPPISPFSSLLPRLYRLFPSRTTSRNAEYVSRTPAKTMSKRQRQKEREKKESRRSGKKVTKTTECAAPTILTVYSALSQGLSTSLKPACAAAALTRQRIDEINSFLSRWHSQRPFSTPLIARQLARK
jgi:hypothetical protein